jgi:hypothetical protein
MTLIAANQHFVSPLYLTGNQLKPTMRMIVVAIQTAMCMGKIQYSIDQARGSDL